MKFADRALVAGAVGTAGVAMSQVLFTQVPFASKMHAFSFLRHAVSAEVVLRIMRIRNNFLDRRKGNDEPFVALIVFVV